jgi:hypothetical protein
MGDRQPAGLEPEHSRLGELDPLAKTLVEQLTASVRKLVDPAPEHRSEATIRAEDVLLIDFEDDERGRQLSPSVFLAQRDRFCLANERFDFALVAADRAPGHADRRGTIPLRHPPDLAFHDLTDRGGGSSGSPCTTLVARATTLGVGIEQHRVRRRTRRARDRRGHVQQPAGPFGELERPAEVDARGDRPGRRIPIEGHVKSIVIID